jgi:hypothetical protein
VPSHQSRFQSGAQSLGGAPPQAKAPPSARCTLPHTYVLREPLRFVEFPDQGQAYSNKAQVPMIRSPHRPAKNLYEGRDRHSYYVLHTIHNINLSLRSNAVIGSSALYALSLSVINRKTTTENHKCNVGTHHDMHRSQRKRDIRVHALTTACRAAPSLSATCPAHFQVGGFQ